MKKIRRYLIATDKPYEHNEDRQQYHLPSSDKSGEERTKGRGSLKSLLVKGEAKYGRDMTSGREPALFVA